jgi:hypothetical protein
MENEITVPMEEGGIKKTGRQFLKFALVGVMNTLVDLAVLNAETNQKILSILVRERYRNVD